MIFVPCVGGISHNEIEDAKPEDLTAGCNVLLNACSTARTLVQTKRTRSPQILGLSVQRLIFNLAPLTLTVWNSTSGMPHWRNFEPRLTRRKHPLAAAREFRSPSDPCGISPRT